MPDPAERTGLAQPYDLETVEPFIAFDLKRFRFTDDMDVIAGLDSRPNLLNLTPTGFEHLVKQLFVAMGAEAWTAIPSKDGGVDAVATSMHLFFGGVCLIQAKRWTGEQFANRNRTTQVVQTALEMEPHDGTRTTTASSQITAR